MEGFIKPRSAAVIGASTNPEKPGFQLLDNLCRALPGRTYPIHPKADRINDVPCYPSVADLPESPDLAVIFTPAATIPGLIEACGRKGIRRVMIQSAGFAETGPEGQALQDQCLSIAHDYGIRLWGPNCMGVVHGPSQLVASFLRTSVWQGKLKPGGVSLIVQSGMLAAGFLIQILSEGYFGLNTAASIGNRMDVDECDLIEYLADDPTTEVLALYLESIRNPERFGRAVRAFGRPVVLLKGGTSQAGARAAMSHTASLAGNALVAEGFFRQLGIVRAYDFVEWMDVTRALVHWGARRRVRRVGVLTFSGAAGIVSSDHLDGQGIELADLSPATMDRLSRIYPPWMPPGNPLDLYPAMERNGDGLVYRTAMEALDQDPGVDAVFIHMFVNALTLDRFDDYFSPLEHYSKPAMVWLIGDAARFRAIRDRLEAWRVPVFTEIQRAVTALKALAR